MLWSNVLKHIIYLDVNNSYGYTTSKFLSTSGFKWMVPKKIDLPVIVLKIADFYNSIGLLKTGA